MSYGRGYVGGKYEATKNLRRAEIAKLVRQDLKEAEAKGELPEGLKISVRVREYAGGGSIDAKIMAMPEGMKVLNRYQMWEQAKKIYSGRAESYRTLEVEAILKRIRAIIQAYNYDDSEPMTDYFHVRFYSNESVDYALERVEREAFEAEFAANPEMPEPPYVGAYEWREKLEALMKAGFPKVKAEAKNAKAEKLEANNKRIAELEAQLAKMQNPGLDKLGF